MGRTLHEIQYGSEHGGTYRDYWHTSTKEYMKDHITEWEMTDSLLNVQLASAKEWRDVCLKYFQTFSKMNIDE